MLADAPVEDADEPHDGDRMQGIDLTSTTIGSNGHSIAPSEVRAF